MRRFIWSAGIATWMIAAGCRHDPVVPVTPQISFKNDVAPIVIGNCGQSGCHDGTREGRALTNYSQVMHMVVPGQPYQSELFNVMATNGPNVMPPSPLPNAQVKIVYIWILQGAKDN